MKMKIVGKNYALFYQIYFLRFKKIDYEFMIYFMNYEFYTKEAIIDYTQ